MTKDNINEQIKTDDYQAGDWGISSFKYEKNGFKGGLKVFGQIIAIEKKVILFEDDCNEYIIEKEMFHFEKREKPKEGNC